MASLASLDQDVVSSRDSWLHGVIQTNGTYDSILSQAMLFSSLTLSTHPFRLVLQHESAQGAVAVLYWIVKDD